MSDYEDILKRQWKDLPTVHTLPGGSWEIVGRNAVYQEGKEGNSASVLFVVGARSPMDDVDEGALAELPNTADGKPYDVTMNRIFHRIWVESDAEWDGVRSFLAKFIAGGKEAVDEMSLEDSFKAFKGAAAVAMLGTRTFINGAGEPQTENTLKSVIPLE
jgi:hypothetical protein